MFCDLFHRLVAPRRLCVDHVGVGSSQGVSRGVSHRCDQPEGRYLAGPLPDGEGLAIADLDLALITKRKRMMDSVGHYSRPELLSLQINSSPAVPVQDMSTASVPLEPVTAPDVVSSMEALNHV